MTRLSRLHPVGSGVPPWPPAGNGWDKGTSDRGEGKVMTTEDPPSQVHRGKKYMIIEWESFHLTRFLPSGAVTGENGERKERRKIRRKEPHQCTSDLGITMDAAYRFLVWQLPSFLPTTRLLSATLRPTVTKETKEFQHLIFFTEGSVHRVSQLITWVSLSSKNRELYNVNRPGGEVNWGPRKESERHIITILRAEWGGEVRDMEGKADKRLIIPHL